MQRLQCPVKAIGYTSSDIRLSSKARWHRHAVARPAGADDLAKLFQALTGGKS
jgi:hypothetical protein